MPDLTRLLDRPLLRFLRPAEIVQVGTQLDILAQTDQTMHQGQGVEANAQFLTQFARDVFGMSNDSIKVAEFAIRRAAVRTPTERIPGIPEKMDLQRDS